MSPILSELPQLPMAQRKPAPISSSNAQRLLNQQELESYAQSARKARATPERLTRPEKGVLLNFFIAHELHLKAIADREALYADAVAELRDHAYCRLRIIPVLCKGHVAHYYSKYPRSSNEDAKAVPYERYVNIGELVKGADGKPHVDKDLKLPT